MCVINYHPKGRQMHEAINFPALSILTPLTTRKLIQDFICQYNGGVINSHQKGGNYQKPSSSSYSLNFSPSDSQVLLRILGTRYLPNICALRFVGTHLKLVIYYLEVNYHLVLFMSGPVQGLILPNAGPFLNFPKSTVLCPAHWV